MSVGVPGELDRTIASLGPWFHNLHLPDGTQTAPTHALGDFPRQKWESLRQAIPEDLRGWTVLDIGCNAGFYSFELARRGAMVTAIDYDEHYLRQARWAASRYGLERQLRFNRRQVYDLAHDDEVYDLVWFMGVMYHLRYPLLGLDIVARKTRRLLMLQTMTCPGDAVYQPPENLPLDQRERMLAPGWPTMAFIERRLADDPTNWWAPNHSCVEALVRSAGLEVVDRPAHEVYLCQPNAQANDRCGLVAQEYASAIGRSVSGGLREE